MLYYDVFIVQSQWVFESNNKTFTGGSDSYMIYAEAIPNQRIDISLDAGSDIIVSNY